LGLINQIVVPTANLDFQRKVSVIIQKIYQLQKVAKSKYIEAEQLLFSELGLSDYVPNEANISIRDLFECLEDDRFDAEYWMPKYDEIIEKIKEYKNGYDTFPNLFTIRNQTSINPEKIYQYVELADVDSALGTVEGYTELPGKELPSRGRMSLKKDDVIMSSLDGSLNKTALITSSEKNLIGSTGFFVLAKKYFEPEVALVLLKSKPIQDYIARQAQGTILTAIPKTSLSRILLPKISIEIQHTIKKQIQEAHQSKAQSKTLLEKAKRAVEIFIEQDEEKALEYLAS
jgi:restriction endonuclease S subunit